MRILIILTILVICTHPSYADDPGTCGDVVTLIKQTFSSIGDKNFTYQLKKNGEVYAILALSAKKPIDVKRTKWRLLERQGDSTTYCVASQGNSIEMLKSIHNGNPPEKYGLPGSGYPRCFVPRANSLSGSFEVRLWANKELGDSTVIYLKSNKGEKNYTFLSSNDNVGYWILLETDKYNANNTCYRSRGDTSDIRINYWPFKDKAPRNRQ